MLQHNEEEEEDEEEESGFGLLGVAATEAEEVSSPQSTQLHSKERTAGGSNRKQSAKKKPRVAQGSGTPAKTRSAQAMTTRSAQAKRTPTAQAKTTPTAKSASSHKKPASSRKKPKSSAETSN